MSTVIVQKKELSARACANKSPFIDPRGPSVRFKALDSWRGICALLVATYHYPRTFQALELPLFRSGWIFVDFFFVLSGFVITYRYFSAPTGIHLQSFLRARVWRLFPLHVMTLALVFILALIVMAVRFLIFGTLKIDGVGHDVWAFCTMLLTHIFLLQGFTSFDRVGFNVPSWSVSVEFWANIFFALMVRYGLFGRWALIGVSATVTALLAMQNPNFYISGDGLTNVARSIQGFALGATVFLILSRSEVWRQGILLGTVLELACLALIAVAVMLGLRHQHLWVLPIFSQ